MSCLDYLIAMCIDQHLPVTTHVREQIFYLALWERRFKLTWRDGLAYANILPQPARLERYYSRLGAWCDEAHAIIFGPQD
jgi:hypothetical protein